jgi:hypothetical protein
MSIMKATYQVVDVKFSEDDDKKWDAKTKFCDLRKINVSAKDLNPLVARLRERLKIELDKYFGEPSDHQYLAMMVDPVMMTQGLPILNGLHQGDLVEKAKAIFKDNLEKEAIRSGNISDERGDVDERGDASMPVILEDKDQDDPITAFLYQNARAEATADAFSSSQSPQTVAHEAFSEYSSLIVDWATFLSREQGLSKFDVNRVKLGDCLYTSGIVDILLWWRKNARKYPLVSRLASRVLAKPDANSLQERVFSMASLIDSKLRQRLGEQKFESLCLLAFNKKFIRESESGANVTLETLIESLQSAASVNQASEVLIKFFDLDPHEDEEDPDYASKSMGHMLREAGRYIDAAGKRKRS